MKRFYTCALAALTIWVVPVVAEACGGIYTVKRGESLSIIAIAEYNNMDVWSRIHRENLELIGPNPNEVSAGMRLRLPCINGLPQGLEGGTPPPVEVKADIAATRPVAAPPRAVARRINLVTAGDFAPFTDKSLNNDGMITDVVHTAMQASDASEGYAVHWINDWAAHLDPLLSDAMMDMGFPRFKPDCVTDTANELCQKYLFSDPMFETLIVLFVDAERPMPFASDADIEGRTLCRPAGHFTHDLDRADRRWITDGKITLEQPLTVAECFEMLTAGAVDAVAINEFTGRAAIKSLDIGARVEVVKGRPLSIEQLHVMVHRDHPQAEQMLAMINSGLRASHVSGAYQKVIDRHMSSIWAEF